MIEGFFGSEMFDSGIFQLGQENLASIFWVVLLFKSGFFRVISVNAFWKFLRFGNSASDFSGVNFCA